MPIAMKHAMQHTQSSTILMALTVLSTITLSLAGGCATLTMGTSQSIPVRTNPEGVEVTVDGRPAGVTPTTLRLKRNQSHAVLLTWHGQTKHFALDSELSPMIAGNIIFGGIIGAVVDGVSGASYTLTPDKIWWDFQSPGAPDPEQEKLEAEYGDDDYGI